MDLLGAHGGPAASFTLPDSSISLHATTSQQAGAGRPRRSSAQQQQQQQHVSPTRTSPGSYWDHGNALRGRRSSSRLSGRRRSQAASYAAAIAQCYSGPRPRRSDLPRRPPPPAPLGSPNSSEPSGIGRVGVLDGGRRAARARRICGGGEELEVAEQ